MIMTVVVVSSDGDAKTRVAVVARSAARLDFVAPVSFDEEKNSNKR